MVFKDPGNHSIELLPFHSLAVAGPGRDAMIAGPGEPWRCGLVRNHQHDFVVARLLDERAHVAAAPRDEDSDALGVTHCASRTNPSLNPRCPLRRERCSRAVPPRSGRSRRPFLPTL